VRICSPVITAAPVLGTLAQLVSEGKLDIAGCVDAPQVRGRHLPVGSERERCLEIAPPSARACGAVLGETVNPVGAGKHPARLHARKGDHRGRRRLHGQLQPLALR
jgi:hypothetical protein